MAVSGSTVSVGTADTTLFNASQDGGTCTVLSITNRDASKDLLVKVTPLHTTDYVVIPPSSERSFRAGSDEIRGAVGKVASGTANVNPAVIARVRV